MLDQGVSQLRSLVIDGATHLWKATGRLIVSNMELLLKTAPENFRLYLDFRHIPLLGRWL
jgi:hypothetical protein